MIKIIRNHGFSIKFDNGFMVNVLFGKRDNCDRYDGSNKTSIYADWEQTNVESMTAEVTVYDSKENLVPFYGQDSLKYQSTKDIVDILFRASIAKIATDMHDFPLDHIHKKEDWE